ncbi:MAG: chemotaxis protein CheW [bacterium]
MAGNKTKHPKEHLELALFRVGDLLCGIDITCVREIIKKFEITTVYDAPKEVRGVLNLRGQIVTILDLRKKIGFDPSKVIDENMRIIVVRLENEDVGLLVDNMADIVFAEIKDMEPPPSNIEGITGIYFSNILKMKDDLVCILNLVEILKNEVTNTKL